MPFFSSLNSSTNLKIAFLKMFEIMVVFRSSFQLFLYISRHTEKYPEKNFDCKNFKKRSHQVCEK